MDEALKNEKYVGWKKYNEIAMRKRANIEGGENYLVIRIGER